MRDAYQIVSDRIGISGAADDAQAYTSAAITGIQPALPPDDNARGLLARYARVKTRLNRLGFFLGRPALALLSEAKGNREANSLSDMDFYSDAGQSAWRPQIIVAELQKCAGFGYQSNTLVTRFVEGAGQVQVFAISLHGGEQLTFRARRLIVAAGLGGTARIVLRSFPNGARLPLLCNSYAYLPCLAWRSLGKLPNPRRTSMCQLSLFFDPDGSHARVSMASLYSYGSLLLHRLIRQSPLPMREGRIVMQFLHSAFVIAGIHHPDEPGGERCLQLRPDSQSPTGDALHSEFRYSPSQRQDTEKRIRAFGKALRMLGCQPLRRVAPAPGASLHYAGTMPYSPEERAFTLDEFGRLHGTKHVFVADGSGFRFLPAKGITLSLMANGHRTALSVVGSLTSQ